MGMLITLIIYLVILGLLVWLAFYVVEQLGGMLPEPILRVVRILIVVVAVIVVVMLLLQLAQGGITLPKIGAITWPLTLALLI